MLRNLFQLTMQENSKAKNLKMKIRSRVLITQFVAVLFLVAFLSARAIESPTSIGADAQFSFSGYQWQQFGETVSANDIGGTASVYLKNSAINLQGVSFLNGVIEFDVIVPNERGFVGVQFRREGNGFEHFYLRPHQSGKPDSNQYTPTFNGNSGWQIYSGDKYSTATLYRFNQWMHVKIVVLDDAADVYIDSDTPVLQITDLKRDTAAGGVALASSLVGAHFANFRISEDFEPLAKNVDTESVLLPEGLVTQWDISTEFSSSRLAEKTELDHELLEQLEWSVLLAESNGIVNIGRVAQLSEGRDTVLARFSIISTSERIQRINFGFSDRVKIFSDRTIIFEGDDTNASRDYRFLGTVGLYDSIYIPLQAGRNDVYFAVTESYGGWAIIAALPK